jgi:RNA polymerase sigma factor for flagellar operon FliA
MDPLTRSERKGIKELEAAIIQLETQLEREPTALEVAQHMGIEEVDVRHRLVTQRSLQGSLDALLDGDEQGERRMQFSEDDLGLAFETDAEVNSRMHEARVALAGKIPRLSDVERAFILLYYCDNLTLREVGARTGEHEVLSGRLKTRVLAQLQAS